MERILSPVKAIRAKCIDCSGGYRGEVANCGLTDCSLYPYRLGRNPNRRGKGGRKPKVIQEQKLETNT